MVIGEQTATLGVTTPAAWKGVGWLDDGQLTWEGTGAERVRYGRDPWMLAKPSNTQQAIGKYCGV